MSEPDENLARSAVVLTSALRAWLRARREPPEAVASAIARGSWRR